MVFLFTSAFLIVVISKCGSAGESKVTLRLSVPSAASKKTDDTAGPRAFPGCSGGKFGIGYAAPTSLQYFITRVQLCESMEIAGSGYSNPKGCTDVYTAGGGSNAYDTYKVEDAKLDTENYIDLMSLASRAKVSAATNSVTPGTYNYGIIETRKPVKFAATVDFGGGSKAKTCGAAGGTITVTPSGSDATFCEATTFSSSFTGSCSEETVTIGTTGGGRFFKFLNPVTLVAGTEYVLDLAFRPEGSVSVNVQSASKRAESCGTNYADANGKIFTAPLVDVFPILRSSTEKSIRESYTVPVTVGTLYIDLYYVGTTADVGTGNIVAADVNYRVPTGSCVSVTPFASNPTHITSESGKVTLKDSTGLAYVTGLTRSATTTAGSVGSVLVNEQAFNAANQALTATAQFVAVEEL